MTILWECLNRDHVVKLSISYLHLPFLYLLYLLSIASLQRALQKSLLGRYINVARFLLYSRVRRKKILRVQESLKKKSNILREKWCYHWRVLMYFRAKKGKIPIRSLGKIWSGPGKIESRKFFQNSPNAARFNLRIFRIVRSFVRSYPGKCICIRIITWSGAIGGARRAGRFRIT